MNAKLHMNIITILMHILSNSNNLLTILPANYDFCRIDFPVQFKLIFGKLNINSNLHMLTITQLIDINSNLHAN